MLYTGRFLNAIIVLTVALAAIILAAFVLRRWDELDKKFSLFGLFWLFTVFLWVSVTLRSLAAAFNNYEIDVFFFKIAQANVFLSAVFLGGYVFETLFQKAWLTKTALIAYGLLAAAGIGATFYYNVEPVDLGNFFVTEYAPNIIALRIFQINVVPMILLLLFDLVKQRSLASLSIVLYLVLGYFDQSGISGWPVLLFRLLFIGSFFIAYIGVSTVLRKEESVVTFEQNGSIGHL